MLFYSQKQRLVLNWWSMMLKSWSTMVRAISSNMERSRSLRIRLLVMLKLCLCQVWVILTTFHLANPQRPNPKIKCHLSKALRFLTLTTGGISTHSVCNLLSLLVRAIAVQVTPCQHFQQLQIESVWVQIKPLAYLHKKSLWFSKL
jgi:hypothetical protein